MDLDFLGIPYMTFKLVQIIIEMYDGLIETNVCSRLHAFFVIFPKGLFLGRLTVADVLWTIGISKVGSRA